MPVTTVLSQTPTLLILGNHLFPPSELPPAEDVQVYMAEDRELCTYVRHHQQKLVLFLASMRDYADELRDRGYELHYAPLQEQDGPSYETRLGQFLDDSGSEAIIHFEIEDRFFEARIETLCQRRKVDHAVIQSPMFLTSRESFRDYVGQVSRPFMADFYKRQRRRLNVMMRGDSPQGDQWSFDQDNRQRLPSDVVIPDVPSAPWSGNTSDVVKLVEAEFASHPGRARDFWWPTTRRAALRWLRDFLDKRFRHFGPYQDAITQRSDTAFHGLLSPMMNTGLITPKEIVERAVEYADSNDIPLNSLEGFVRQVIGWREFIRGIYQEFDEKQRSENFWGHSRSLTDAWYAGDTGIPPLDDAIRCAIDKGWSHHIARLMIVGNMMTLCEIEPIQAHTWFMETHVDSSDWVMGPNVYGMGLFSDGGIFATKPYICGSNYLRKMSDYKKGPWCDVVDGLYWRFVDKHRDFFSSNHRLSMMVKTLDRMNLERRDMVFAAAEKFLTEQTK